MGQIRELINYLNERTKEYDEGCPTISDAEWDKIYFKLKTLEDFYHIYYPDSPTQSVQYSIATSFEKIAHDPPMLSLAKTKDIGEAKSFVKDRDYIVSLKLDGLSCRLEYNKGRLVSASSRGNGEIGDLVTENVRTCRNVPTQIPYPNHLIIDGEIIITAEDFRPFELEYKNPRNLAAGSLKLLDSAECAKRHLSFVAWDVLSNGPGVLSGRLNVLSGWGFTTVPYVVNDFDKAYAELPEIAKSLGYPIDGLVIKYDEVKYYRSLGATSHHPSGALSLKFYDELYETTLKRIDYQVGRSGQITPIAIFDSVDTGDSTIEKASLSNDSVLYATLGVPYIGQRLWVSKRNCIIPYVERADKESRPNDDNLYISSISACPVCGSPILIKSDGESDILYCSNSECEGRILNKLKHFVSKAGLDIKGLSEQTLNKLLDWNWIESAADIFKLQEHRNEWIQKPGFGIKSVDNILNAIESSRKNKLDKFIAALGIPLIGTSAAKVLANQFGTWEFFIEAVNNDFKFYTLPDFGPEAHSAIINFNYEEANNIYNQYLTLESVSSTSGTKPLEGLTFVITGSLSIVKNREELKQRIEEAGGKVVGSISKKTNYLITNNSESGSAKAETAKKLGVPILSEESFLKNFLT